MTLSLCLRLCGQAWVVGHLASGIPRAAEHSAECCWEKRNTAYLAVTALFQATSLLHVGSGGEPAVLGSH